MKRLLVLFATLTFAAALGAGGVWLGPLTSPESRSLVRTLHHIDDRLTSGEILRTAIRVREGEGIPSELEDGLITATLRFPDRLRLEAEIDGKAYLACREEETVWLAAPAKEFAVVGDNRTPRFNADPSSVEVIELPAFRNPLSRWHMALLPALITVEPADSEPDRWTIRFRDLVARSPEVPDDLLLAVTMDEKKRPGPLTLSFGETELDLEIEAVEWSDAGEADSFDWSPPVDAERIALAHLAGFGRVALANLDAKIPSLPPLDGSREVIARHGKGRLEKIEGTAVLFLQGTPEEMGEQHGRLMRDRIHNLVDRIVYGVGVGSSFDKGRWFFGEIEEAQARLAPFTDPRYLREMDAMAQASGLHVQEARIANFFPELFHCSGFALHGAATRDGTLYHGRILDYLRGLGLEENATVMIVEPDEGLAWVNVGYAGFVGTVTAMNEEGVAIGEMGGRGEGDWDGKPMAQLMREVMERASTIDEAVAIMREGPRTCEYYYVISDGKSNRAVGIKATPEILETVWSGETHPQLPRPVEDTVLLSAGERYDHLVDRVEAHYGTFDADSARALMERPVCMTSNIQSVLFAPETLDFWVANADSENVASHTRYTQYNLRDLLKPPGSSELTSR